LAMSPPGPLARGRLLDEAALTERVDRSAGTGQPRSEPPSYRKTNIPHSVHKRISSTREHFT
jgi:hypothetical protein